MQPTPYRTYKAQTGIKLPTGLQKSLPGVPHALRHNRSEPSSQSKPAHPQLQAGLSGLRHTNPTKRRSPRLQKIVQQYFGLTEPAVSLAHPDSLTFQKWSNQDTIRILGRSGLARRYWIQNHDPLMRTRLQNLLSLIS